MKTRIRTLALLLAFLLALPLADGMAYATESIGLGGLGETVTEAQLETAAIEYVDRYVKTAFCYKEVDFAEKTLLALVRENKIAATPPWQSNADLARMRTHHF